ncbi:MULTISPECIES: hypothetical protein [unclassified Thermosynechococcus]|uniref:hypothetical protein n=1 Tax=unclassified Thermosynechococcus TaxID=2622553 RepID=UPI002873ABB4|nr:MULTISPECIES: hypothetical protein [unclassified Thermosynechococcus]WNC32696.1 hypothetical protein RHH81_00920 [Thermosynechococcus sp. PKX95]WNC35224.1 hypothetical protein RHH79_00920 [Thermosynechococcus sp. PKX91]WNC37743.1 hypothetical protein RHI11_00925 [Thermosynechococcus sp. WL11]WNC40264.1 hypothetical protein RHI18_00925 [Thermosynechococcus sp. WL17]WNC42784.1 hypothetical protein RHI14_00925 [Thermosynechococcus sp. WL15]
MFDKPLNRTYERIMVAIASANFLLVLFDLTYIPLRDFWLLGKIRIPLIQRVIYLPQPLPMTALYDPIKGIEPHRTTERYINTVNQLRQTITTEGVDAAATQALLAQLREQSKTMVDTDPFALANKTGTLERIKNLMRLRVFGDRNASSKQSFERFWSPEYINERDWQTSLAWFEAQIIPLMATNYWRRYGEDGNFIDRFDAIDLPFTLLFFVEFLGRTFWLSRQYRAYHWRDAMFWRWYDVLLFFPFWWLAPTWAWLRIIPVTIRLDQAEIICLDTLERQASQGVVAAIATDISEVVVLQVLTQLQKAIRRGQLSRWLPRVSGGQGSKTLNDIDELGELAALVVQVVIYRVIPQLRPEVEGLVAYSVDQVLRQAPPYRRLLEIPSLEALPRHWHQSLAKEISDRLFLLLEQASKHQGNPPREGALLASQLAQKFGQTLTAELQEEQVGKVIQDLLVMWLEEIKINFVRQTHLEGIETVLDETRALQESLEQGRLKP